MQTIPGGTSTNNLPYKQGSYNGAVATGQKTAGEEEEVGNERAGCAGARGEEAAGEEERTRGERAGGAEARGENGDESEWPYVRAKGGHKVSVYRNEVRAGYFQYQVVWYQDGQRKREALADPEAAKKRARNLIDSLNEGQVDAAALKLQDQQAYNSALGIIEPTGMTLEAVCREYAACFAALDGRSPLEACREVAERRRSLKAQKTVREVIDEMLDAKEAGRATRKGSRGRKIGELYKGKMKGRLDRLEKEFSERLISEISSDELNDWVAELEGPKGEELSGRTRNNYVESLSVLWRYADKRGYVASDSKVVPMLERYATDDFEISIFTPEEMGNVLKAAGKVKGMLPCVAIGAFAGVRTYEITRLDWADFRWDEGLIEIRAQNAKTRARRFAPLTENLKAWLAPVRKESGPVWENCAQYLCERYAAVADEAGLEWKHNVLRHSFISYRVAATKNVNATADESGNSAEMIFQHYRELVTPAAGAEWFSIAPEAISSYRHAGIGLATDCRQPGRQAPSAN